MGLPGWDDLEWQRDDMLLDADAMAEVAEAERDDPELPHYWEGWREDEVPLDQLDLEELAA